MPSKHLARPDHQFDSPSLNLLRFAQSFSRQFPVLDAGCGFGRNAVALAQHAFTVVCADRNEHRLQELMRFAASNRLARALLPVQIELFPSRWPFAPASFSAVVFVHYLDLLLLPSVHRSLVAGGCLYVETVGGQGGNHLELPDAGKLRTLLSRRFQFDSYEERLVGPVGGNKCAVKLCARKRR